MVRAASASSSLTNWTTDGVASRVRPHHHPLQDLTSEAPGIQARQTDAPAGANYRTVCTIGLQCLNPQQPLPIEATFDENLSFKRSPPTRCDLYLLLADTRKSLDI